MRQIFRFLPLLAAAALLAPAAACAAVIHTVRRGETLSSIAAADGLSVARLAAANGLSSMAELTTGAQLVIPPQGGPLQSPAAPPAAPTSSESPMSESGASASGGYVVRLGDTLSGIAARYGTSVEALAAANGIPVNGLLLAGRALTIPGREATSTPSSSASSSAPSISGAQPVAQFVTAAQVGSIAVADGVPAPLAEAIADQESGFNDALVSSSGAVGVMQLEPATWSDLTRVDGMDLSPTSALDNVRGGVVLLRSLLLATGESQTDTIAAYYQGLRSVQTYGILPGTRGYVADVRALESRFNG
jgi:LysM repeat protein